MIIFGFPLSALLTSLLGIENDLVTVAFRFLAIVPALTLIVFRGFRNQLSFPSMWPAVFILIYLSRLIYDALYGENTEGAIVAIQYFLLTIVIPTFAMAVIRKSDWNENAALQLTLIFGVIFLAAVLLLLQLGTVKVLGADNEDVLSGAMGERLGFNRLNPISLGQTAASLVLCCVAVYLRQASRKMKLLLIVIASISVYVVILASSRGPIVALIVATLLLILISGKGFWLLVATALGVTAAGLFSVLDIDALLETTRFSDIGNDVNSIARFDLAGEAIDAFLTSPIYGTSFDLPFSGGWPHNLFAEVLMATGLVGGAVFAIIITQTILKAYSLTRKSINIASLMFVQAFVSSQFSGSLWGYAGVWLGIAMLSAGLSDSTLRGWAKRARVR